VAQVIYFLPRSPTKIARLKNNLLIVILISLVTGCAAPPTEKLAVQNNFKKTYIQTTKFNLATYQKILKPGANVNIYIEGDGSAWSGRYRLSPDPSPRSGTTMQLATLDPNPNVVYLARPCQYSPQDLKTVCDSKYWSLARYSPEVVNALDMAISQIKRQCAANQVNLIGYSGGGALAVLITAQRTDVASIRTVAGNLDLNTMDKIHDTTPLSESLDPLAVAQKVRHIPQLHFVGGKDYIVPEKVAKSFVKEAGLDSNAVVVIKKAAHNTHWDKNWPQLLQLECISKIQ
jgi:hypothetical protein